MYFLPLSTLRLGSSCRLLSFVDIKQICCRKLFTKEELGVTHFEQLRKDAKTYFKNNEEIKEHKENFLQNFQLLRLDEQRNSLKQYLLLIDDKSDLENLKKFLQIYHDSFNNCVHYVKEFIFGTPIMRLLYVLNLPDEAVKFYKDPDLKNVFEQMQTYKVMLSLLYKNKRYDELFSLYKEIRMRLDLLFGEDVKPDITIICLAFAVCYHLDTPEHFEYAQNLWKNSNVQQLNRSRYFLAGLAIKQNRPDFALSLVEDQSSYVTVRFIKLLAFTQLGEFDQACDVLYQTIENYKQRQAKKRPCVGTQMVTDLQEAILKSGTDEQINRLNQIYDELKALNLLSDETLDRQLCASFPPMLPRNIFLKMKKKNIERKFLLKSFNAIKTPQIFTFETRKK